MRIVLFVLTTVQSLEIMLMRCFPKNVPAIVRSGTIIFIPILAVVYNFDAFHEKERHHLISEKKFL